MKNVIILIALAVTVTACGSKTEKQTATKDANPVEHYLALKDALVATDAQKAQTEATKFLKVNSNESLKANLEAIAATTDVAEQRKAFENLSIAMYSIVKTEGVETPLYKQFCPMAFSGKGAYWLAAEEEVNNPYYGDRMLHCGSVQETISQ